MSRLDEIRARIRERRHPLSLTSQDVVRFDRTAHGEIRCISTVTQDNGLVISIRPAGSSDILPVFYAETVREGDVLTATRLTELIYEFSELIRAAADGIVDVRSSDGIVEWLREELYWEPYDQGIVATFMK